LGMKWGHFLFGGLIWMSWTLIHSAPASAFLILKSFRIIPLRLSCRVPARMLARLLSDGPALGFQKKTLSAANTTQDHPLGRVGGRILKIETSLLHRTRESHMTNGSARLVDPKKVTFRSLFYASSNCWRKIACSFRNPFFVHD
jgi:hypothetical protein